MDEFARGYQRRLGNQINFFRGEKDSKLSYFWSHWRFTWHQTVKMNPTSGHKPQIARCSAVARSDVAPLFAPQKTGSFAIKIACV